MSGTKTELELLIQSAFGFEPKIVDAILATTEGDVSTLVESIHGLSQSLNVHSRVAPFLAEILHEM